MRRRQGQLQTVLHVPLPDISGAGGENSETLGSVVSVHGQTEPHVIGILVILDAVREEQCQAEFIPS